MKALPVLLAAALAAGAAAPAAARDRDGPAPATRAAAGDEAGGCAMMKDRPKAARGKQPAMGMPGHMQPPMLEPALPPRQAAALGLDPDQRQRLAALEKDNRTRQWALLGELREERLALAEQLAAAEPDPAAATARLRAVQDVQARLLEARLGARRDALALLTPEQRAQLRAAPQQPHSAAGGGRDAAPKAGEAEEADEDEDEDESGRKAPGGGAGQDPHAGHH